MPWESHPLAVESRTNRSQREKLHENDSDSTKYRQLFRVAGKPPMQPYRTRKVPARTPNANMRLSFNAFSRLQA